MRIYLSDKAASELSKQAEAFNVPGSLIGRALIETIVKEGIVNEMLAGVDLEEMVKRPKKPTGKGMYRFQGQRLSATGISMITGVNPNTFSARVRMGWSIEKAAWTPPKPCAFNGFKGAEEVRA